MSTLLTSLGAPMLAWLGDYYFVATLLLLAALVGRRFVRQPAHRILIAWTVMLELVVLAVVCALPFWPRISFVAAPTPKAVAVAEAPKAELPAAVERPMMPMHSMPSMPLPPMIGRSSRNVVDSAPVEPPVPEVEVVQSAAPAPQPQMTWSEWAVAAYLAGAALVGLWLCWGAAATTWLCWRAKPAADSLKAELSDVVRNRRREPRLLVSPQVATAVALGVLRPTIVLPDAMVQASPPRTLRAVLLHEWAHIRHGDLWLLALGRFLLAVLFTHPLFWLLRRAVRGDQELLADAVAAGDNPHDYAEELVRLVRMTGDDSPRSVSAAVGIWEGRSSFSRRIAMLLDETFRVNPTGSRRWRLKALAAMTVVGLICSLVTLQPARSPADPKEDGERTEITSSTEATPQQAVRIAGTYVDSEKRPIADVEVSLYGGTSYVSLSLLETRRTDAAGKFSFSELHLDAPAIDEHVRGFLIVAKAKGKARTCDSVNIARIPDDIGRLELTMHDAATITGRVVDANGKPIAGVKLLNDPAWYPPDCAPVCLATTNADGFFEVSEADAQGGALEAVHPDFTHKTEVYPENPDKIDFTLEPASFIEGRVIDAVTGKPAAETLVMADRNGYVGFAGTDKEGRYRLSVSAGKYNIKAVQKGRTVHAIESFDIKTSETRTAPDLRLIEGGFIEGRVIDVATGQPLKRVPGDSVRLEVYGPASPSCKTHFESPEWHDGVFRFRVAPGRNNVAVIDGMGDWEILKDSSFDEKGRMPIEVVEGQTTRVDFKVSRLARAKPKEGKARSGPSYAPPFQQTVRVVGTCVDANNRPIAGAEVCLYERTLAASHVLLEQRRTDPAGKFAFSDLHLNVPKSDDDLRCFYVQARAKGKARDGDGFTSAMIREDVRRCKLTLYDATTITGRVTDTNGKPVAGATICRMYGPLGGSTDPNCLATTDADGFYRATDAPKIGPKFHRGLLHVRHPDFFIDAVAYEKNRDKIDFVLTPASIIEGKVIDAVTGKPAAHVYAYASVIRPDGYKSHDLGLTSREASATITDAEGRYRLPVAAGKHIICALQRGRTARAIEGFEIKAGERRTAPDLQLIEGGFIEARVVDAETGQPPKYRHGGDISLNGPSHPLGATRTHTFEYRQDSVISMRVVPGMNYVAFDDSASKEKLVEVVKDSSFDSKGRKPVEVVEGQTAKVEFKVRRIVGKEPKEGKARNDPSYAPLSQQTVHPAGTCVDSDNHPIADAEVSLYSEVVGASFTLLEKQRTDAAGKFAFAELRLGVPTSSQDVQHFLVVARTKGKTRTFGGFHSETVRNDVGHLKMEMLEAAPIAGRVTDPSGKPIAGALISPLGLVNTDTDPTCLAKTDANGFYQTTEASRIGGTVRRGFLTASHRDFLWKLSIYEEQPDKLNFVLQTASHIDGKVVDTVTGKPAANVRVVADDARPDDHPAYGRIYNGGAAVTDANGRYRLSVEPGTYHIYALQKGRTVRAITSFEIRAGEDRLAPDLKLIEGTFLEVRVVNAETGQPAEDIADLCLRLHGPSRPLGTKFAEQWWFQYQHNGVLRVRVAPGTNYIEFDHAAGKEPKFEVVKDSSFDEKGRKAVEVAEGQTAKVEFRVKWKTGKMLQAEEESDRRNPPTSPKPAKEAPATKQTSPAPPARFQDLPADAKEYLRDIFRSEEIFSKLSDPEERKWLALTEEQEATFRTIDKEIADWTKDMLKTKDRAMAVLTSEQRLRLPKESLGPEGPRDCGANTVVVKGDKDQIQVPSPYPYPDLSDPSVQKSLGFTAEQAEQVRAVLGDCEKANDLLAREAIRLTPAEYEKQSKYFAWCKDFSLLDEVAKAPDESKALDKIRSERQTWRTSREKQPLVKRALEIRKQFEAVLMPEQMTKYREMAFAEIIDTALNDPLTLMKIGVSKEQRAAVQRIYDASQTQQFEFLRKTDEKMLKILDPQQREVVLKAAKKVEEASEKYSRELEDKNSAAPASKSSSPKPSHTVDSPTKPAASKSEPAAPTTPTKRVPAATGGRTQPSAASQNPADTVDSSEGFSRTAQIVAALSDPDWSENTEMAGAESTILEVLSEPAIRKNLGVTADQERKLQPILQELDQLCREGGKFTDKAMAVLTPEQRARLRKEAMGPEGPVDSCSMTFVVKGESKETKIPLPHPYPDLSDADVQKQLGFSAEQTKRVRAILGDCPTLRDLLMREAARFTPAEREAQAAYYCFYPRNKSIGPNLLATPARRKELWEKQAADRRAWRAERDKQPLVKRCAELSKKFEAVLTPEQAAKYREMAYTAAEFAAIDDPLTWSKIGASGEQSTAVLDIYTESITKSVKFACTATKKTLAILDRSQREKLRKDLQVEKAEWEKLEQKMSQEPTAETDASPAEPAAAKSKSAEVSGRVVDEAGKGIAGADVGLQEWTRTSDELPNGPFLAAAKADADGRFRLLVPEGHDLRGMNAAVWAMADGYQPWRPNPQGSLSEPMTVKLVAAGTVFRIVDEKGKGIAGVRVTVLSQNLPHSVNYPIPPDWIGRMSGVTDADGRVRIASAVPDALAEVLLQPPGGVPRVRLNRDFFLNHRPDKSTPQFTWAWPAKGNIKGRIEVQGGKLPANLKISITTESKLPNSIALVGTYGEATAAVDAEGRFEIDGIAAGPITVAPFLDDRQPLRAEIPSGVKVEAGKTASLTIPVRPGVLVRGQIRKQDTKQGYPNFSLWLIYGQSAQREHRDMSQRFELETDQQGRFSAVVPPGAIELRLLSAPRDYTHVEHWKNDGGIWGARRVVPAGKDSYDLDPIELVPTVSLSGTLVDLDGKPLAGYDWDVFGYPHIPDRDTDGVMNCFGGVAVDQDGHFSDVYPQTFPPVRWEVSHRRWPKPSEPVEDKWHAKVLSRAPFVLQAPVHGSAKTDKTKPAKARSPYSPSPSGGNTERPAPAPMDDRVTKVEGSVMDDATGRPVEDFAIQGGKVDEKDPAKIIWGEQEGGRFFPLSEARFSVDIAWGLGGRARIVAAGYLPQSILDQAPSDKVRGRIERVVRLKRGRGISGRVVYHDGTPAAGAAVFLVGNLRFIIGDGKALEYTLKFDEKTKQGTWEKTEDKSVTKTIADADGRFTLPDGGDFANRIAVSAPRLDLWMVPIPADVAAKKAEMTIKLPEPGRLVVKYDIPGGEPQAKLFLQIDKPKDDPNWPFSMMSGPDNSHEPSVANKGQVVFDNLPPGKYMLALQTTYLSERHIVAVESGKTTTSGFVRDHGAAVEGRVVGLKRGMSTGSDNSQPGATVCVCPESVTGDLVSAAFLDRNLSLFDVRKCGMDGRFKTGLLLPGKYAIIAEVYVPEKKQEMPAIDDSGKPPEVHIPLPAFVGRTVVTVPESGQPPEVKIEMEPRDDKPPANSGENAKKPSAAKDGEGEKKTENTNAGRPRTRPKSGQTDPTPAVTAKKSERILVDGHIVDDETGEPVKEFVIQGGRVDDKDATKIKWGYFSSRSESPVSDGRFQHRIDWAGGWRARILAAGYVPQPILDKPPADGATSVSNHVVRLKRGRDISGRVLYHDGTPAVGASVFLVGNLGVTISNGQALQGMGSMASEVKSVARATTDAHGRFKLSGGGGDLKRIAVSAPRVDLWVVPAPEDAAEGSPELVIKLPEPGRLVVKYDISGGDAEAKLFLQMNSWDSLTSRGIGNIHEPVVANKGQVVIDNLPPGKYILDRNKTFHCDRRDVVIESGKTTESSFIRDRGAAVVGRIVGLKEGMVTMDERVPGANVCVRPVSVTGDTLTADWKLPTFDAFACGPDGKFKTEQLLPGQYAIIAEAWRPATREEMAHTGHRLPAFVGRTVVTVPESGRPPEVTIEMKPRDAKPRGNNPPARSVEKAKKPKAGLSVKLKVTDAKTKEPIESFTVNWSGRELHKVPYSWGGPGERFSNGRNEFHQENPWPETSLRIEADGYRPFITRTILGSEGEVELDIAMKPDAGIAGNILLPDGAPAAGASVTLCTRNHEVTVEGGKLQCRQGNEDHKLAKTAADGSFRLPAEVDSWIIVVAHDSGYAEATAAEFAKTSSKLQLKPWGRLEGELLLNGKPIAGQELWVWGNRSEADVVLFYHSEATTDAVGKFVMERVPPVGLGIQPALKRGSSTYSFGSVGRISIASGTTTRIILPQAGRPLIGRVALPKESKLHLADLTLEAKVFLRPPSISGAIGEVQEHWDAYGAFMKSELGKAFKREKIVVNADGTFRIEGLPATAYVIQVSDSGKGLEKGAFTSRRVTVPPLCDSKEPADVGELGLVPQEEN